MAAALQSQMGSVQSERLQHALKLTPLLLRVYCTVALRDVNECKLFSLIDVLKSRDGLLQKHDYLVTYSLICKKSLIHSSEFIFLRFGPCWIRS